MTLIETPPLSQHLRDATAAVHRDAESSPFVVALVEGTLPRAEYARLVRQLHAVYSVLEEATAASDDPDLAPLLAPELLRLPAFSADLEYLVGPAWERDLATLPATDEYCERIRSRCFDSSPDLLAHHYVRYLGDLSGGQILGRVVARVYELPDRLGTSAYWFDAIDSPKQFKDDYRDRLDALPWDRAVREQVAAEAVHAFGLNTAVFRDLHATTSEDAASAM